MVRQVIIPGEHSLLIIQNGSLRIVKRRERAFKVTGLTRDCRAQFRLARSKPPAEQGLWYSIQRSETLIDMAQPVSSLTRSRPDETFQTPKE
jgi:hypothetical protein